MLVASRAVHSLHFIELFSALFQQRREEFERHIREQEEELLQQENEIKERQEWQTKQEESEEVEKESDSGPSDQNQWLPFDYTSYVTPSADFNFTDGREILTSPGDSDHPQGTASVNEVLSPVPGSTSWESDLSEIDLIKGQEGLGFSLLDFAVSSDVS